MNEWMNWYVIWEWMKWFNESNQNDYYFYFYEYNNNNFFFYIYSQINPISNRDWLNEYILYVIFN